MRKASRQPSAPDPQTYVISHRNENQSYQDIYDRSLLAFQQTQRIPLVRVFEVYGLRART